MIPPHGNTLVDQTFSLSRSNAILDEFETFPTIELSENLAKLVTVPGNSGANHL